MIETCKLTYRAPNGDLFRSEVTLEYAKNRIFFLDSPFALKDEIKSMRGSHWCGYDDEPRKIWSIKDCQRNRFQLDYLKGVDVYAWFDRPVVRHAYTRPLLDHQKDLADQGLTYHYHVFAAEMGCVDGSALVSINRCGKGFKMSLSDLYQKFNGGGSDGGSGVRHWDLTEPTYIRSLCGDSFHLNRIVAVLSKGVKRVVALSLKSDKTLRVTPDHEICVGYGEYKEAASLSPGDCVLSNGVKTDKDGYVRVHGVRHPRETTGGVYEHILVAEKMLGRPLHRGETVHHKNRVKHDNRPENLEVLAGSSEHAALHGVEGGYKRLNGGKVCFVPCFDTVVSVEADGEAGVYDVVCEDPHHNFVANGVVVHNCGKTLSAQEVMERSGVKLWWWVGPKTSLPNIEREFRRWNLDPSIEVKFFTYEGLVKVMDELKGPVPMGVVFDESSRLKGDTSQRSEAAQDLADRIRDQYDMDGYVIEMSGTPSPKTPLDWWRPAEIAYPGYLKEGSRKAMEQRMAFMEQQSFNGQPVNQRISWRDDERKCHICGNLAGDDHEGHDFKASVNEVALLNERLKGLITVKMQKDCLDLPEKQYRVIECPPSPSVKRVSQALVAASPNAVTAATLLRELSDGFQYREEEDGTTLCPHCKGTKVVEEWFSEGGESYQAIDMLKPEFVASLRKEEIECPRCGGSGEIVKMRRYTKEVSCPKDAAIRELLDECDEQGRIVIFAAFTGSIDKLIKICHLQGWSTVRCDQGNYVVQMSNGDVVTGVNPLDFWADKSNCYVAFVANSDSGSMSLTLIESRMAVFYSNSFKPESRVQAEERIHRMGMDNRGCWIVDLIHLPSDQRVLDIVRENRRIELMTLGQFMGEDE